jgi:hypothetical protein
LYSHGVVREIETRIFLEFRKDVFDEGDIEVLTAEMGVSVGRLDLKYATLELEDGNIEGSTSQIVDGHDVFPRLVHTVRKGGGGGFVDDPEHSKSCYLASILRCLSLGVVEVGWNGDNGVEGRCFDGGGGDGG